MADEFGQRIQGLHQAGDATVSTDRHIAVFGKDGSGNYEYLSISATGLVVDVANTSITVTATDLDIRDLSHTQDSVKIGDGTDFLAIDASGFITVNVNGTVTVTATDLDIRDLSHTQDSVKIGDGTDFLAVNADGSINVVTSGSAGDSIYTHGSATLVKDTINTVVTRAPSVDEQYAGIMVSGAGYCEWQLEFGTTGAEAVILKFWTTPSHPTEYVDLPDYLTVSNGETIRVRGTNREKAASPASDFTGYASLIRKA